MGFGMTPTQCGIHSKSQPLLQKIFLFYVSKTLAAYARMCLCTYALAHIRWLLPCTWAEGYFGHFISKNIFLHI